MQFFFPRQPMKLCKSVQKSAWKHIACTEHCRWVPSLCSRWLYRSMSSETCYSCASGRYFFGPSGQSAILAFWGSSCFLVFLLPYCSKNLPCPGSYLCWPEQVGWVCASRGWERDWLCACHCSDWGLHILLKLMSPIFSVRSFCSFLNVVYLGCVFWVESKLFVDNVWQEASFEYLQNEGERLLLEAMDELEVAFNNTNVRTDCNHIFLNFVPTVIMDPSKVWPLLQPWSVCSSWA